MHNMLHQISQTWDQYDSPNEGGYQFANHQNLYLPTLVGNFIYPVVNTHCGELFIRCCSVLHPDLGPMCYQYTIYSYARVLDLPLYRNWHCGGKYDMSLLNVMVSDKLEHQIHSFRMMLIQICICICPPHNMCDRQCRKVVQNANKELLCPLFCVLNIM